MKKTKFNPSIFIIFILLSGCVTSKNVAQAPESDDVMARARAVKMLPPKAPTPTNCEKLGTFSILQSNRNVTPQVQAARAFGNPNYVKHMRVSVTGVGKADDYDVFNCGTQKN